MAIIEVKCKGNRLVRYDQLSPFQGELKKTRRDSIVRLKEAILHEGFVAPFFVWKDAEGSQHIIDGHQRYLALTELDQEGNEIPKLPAIDIVAEDIQDAKRKLLHIASQYGDFTKRGLLEFTMDLDLSGFQDTIRLAGGEFKLDLDEGKEEPPEVEFTQELLEEHNYIVLYFDNTVDWQQARTLFELETVKALDSKKGFEKKGVGRVLYGPTAIEQLRADLSKL